MSSSSLHGSCFCKKIQLELSGEPHAIALCHCTDCRKISGSVYTLNFIVSTADLKISGSSPAENPKTSDSGKRYVNYFCKDCGKFCFLPPIPPLPCLSPPITNPTKKRKITNLWLAIGSPLYGGAVDESGKLQTAVVRAGCFDDLEVLKGKKPSVEIYTAQRMEWILPVEGAAQFEGMLPAR
ncbi:hypothetical protein D6C86_10360 [Aureobasidium pullulans]|uniref:CENP-V/GFA domain-containing protein n=1 Tax=Aureobasidium pullulans TaxID=5580 RepID=A0A4S9UE06_AURPU|nr:hypothetical protein D6C94_10469 [Aureobasidium pullulans]THZ35706.1 hypothetical protein D6C87_09644 [Aureobasidium pullulans]THZ51912.1 hypothetical protein D6C86_10360 [Aureobasidium pullulans]